MKKALVAWMSLSAMILLLAMGVAAQQADNAGCKDHPLFPTRMPDYRIGACKVEDFGVYEFFAIEGPEDPGRRQVHLHHLRFHRRTGQRTERSRRCPQLRERHPEGGGHDPAERARRGG